MEQYGNGKSTGLDQTALGKSQTGLTPQVLTLSGRDRDILRRLAERVARIAASAGMAEKRDFWKRHNRLEKVRPLVFCDPENGWNEIITEAQMEAIRRDLRESLEKTQGCVVEIIMKDNHTIGGRPENLVEWCRIAQEEAERISRRG
jgi:hypothetical protein